ncbi:FemAB family XrtA/PEP-CTERM system-associated protein [Sphingomonas sp.]|uniref:FemAB family XrtA/PEP-CTERM system-associated protein n=1 Tax=Sphingomonas sp. TaxID=28214 RepID=UPI002CE03C69|nr:FemAB family XrtA/PEP-CTERM system-associated protein [Sphingomonas sp.]HTG39614.1 FemAB family XrtA/PEP-CTERM system-associated protein [Sphingomonas sp.]
MTDSIVREADPADPRDAARIEAYLVEQPRSTPFHLPGWSRAVTRGTGQRSHYMIAQRAGGIAGVLPLTDIRSPVVGHSLSSVGFAVDGGILADDDAAHDALEAAGWALAQRLGAQTLELRGGAVRGEGWYADDTTYLAFARELTADHDTELAAIPRKQRAEVRRALGLDLTVTTGSAPRDRAAHYRAYAESVRNLGTPVFPRALFAAMLDELGDRADILTVWHGDRAVASTLSVYWGGTMFPFWGGGVRDARTLRANERMFYAYACHAIDRGCRRLDLGRSKAGTGPAAFKKNLGYPARPLTYWRRTLDGAAPRTFNPLDPKYARKTELWKKLPLPVANLIGPHIARGLG